MGRSVSYATGSTSVCYRTFKPETPEDSQFEWEYFEDWLRETAAAAWPSLEPCDNTWLGREDHAILENAHAYIGVSEYCGLVSIWLAPKDNSEHPELSEHWCNQISAKFEKLFGEYRKIATASNGESFYERA